MPGCQVDKVQVCHLPASDEHPGVDDGIRERGIVANPTPPGQLPNPQKCPDRFSRRHLSPDHSRRKQEPDQT